MSHRNARQLRTQSEPCSFHFISRQIGRADHSALANGESSLSTRNQGLTVANVHTGAGYLQTRSWQGLEQNLGQTEVKKASEGVKGIAMGYENEKKAL